MNKQEAFTKVVTHLLKQMARSVKAGDQKSCMYRGQDGLMCAVGCLIPDNVYVPLMEGQPSSQIFSGYSRLQALFEGFDQDFDHMLFSLQTVHDTYEPAQWREELVKLSVSYGLEMPS